MATTLVRKLFNANRKGAKFRFTITLEELQLITDGTWKPERFRISFEHGRRLISSKTREWDTPDEESSKLTALWLKENPEKIDIVTTLYNENNTAENEENDKYQYKEWTIVVDYINKKGIRKPIAAVEMNVTLFKSGSLNRCKFKLLPLNPAVKQSIIIIVIKSLLIEEISGDAVSKKSSIAAISTDETDAVPRILSVPKTIDIQGGGGGAPPIPKHQKIRETEEIVFEEQAQQPAKFRPLWRVSAEEEKTAGPVPEIQKRQSRTSRASTEEKTTTTVFEIDSNSRPIPVQTTTTTTTVTQQHLNTGTLPRQRSNSPRAPSRDAVPQPVKDEDLMAWCQRITNGYFNVKITDFTKSWRNGLALCAILHTYRPDLIGDYSDLDFSNRVDGRKSNIKKALAAATMMGLSDVPDENYFLTPDRKQIELLLQKLRRIFEGNFEDATPTSASDHRISNMFGISEAEQKVVDMINKIRETEDLENAVDYTNVEEEAEEPEKVNNTNYTPQITKKRPTEESTDDEAETSNLYFGRGGDVSITMVTPGFTNIRASGRQASPSKRDELRKRARDLLEKSSTLPNATTITPQTKKNEEEERRREQARKLLEDATIDGTTFKLTANRAAQSMNSTPFRSKLGGSSNDLRRVGLYCSDLLFLELVRPNVDVHRFKKRDPSPILVRKPYDPNDTPHVPAIGRGQNGRNGLMTSSTLDRVKRYGSMRSAELKESLQVLAKQYGYGMTASQDSLATPTKKYASQWEKDVHDIEGTGREQEKIEERLIDVEQQSKAIKEKIGDTEKGSSEEQMLLETFLRLTNEKNTLVGRQEYYNIIEMIRKSISLIDELAKKLDEVTRNTDDYPKSAEEKNQTDKLMEEYKNALDQKSSLTQKLFTTEEEIRDDEERLNNLTLERASRFVRGVDEPVSASKRLIQWWRR